MAIGQGSLSKHQRGLRLSIHHSLIRSMLLEKRFFSKCLQQVSAAARWGSNSSSSISATRNISEIETFYFWEAKQSKNDQRHNQCRTKDCAYVVYNTRNVRRWDMFNFHFSPRLSNPLSQQLRASSSVHVDSDCART